MHEPWRIEMLGGLQIRQGNTVINRFKTQKAAGVLAFLALFPRRTHTREELIDLFWPEVDVEKGRPSLSVALSSLRNQMEPPGVPAGSVITADVVNVRLNPEAVVTDVAEFESHLAAAQTAAPPERLRRLEAADALYRGELLLGRYDEWLFGPRDRLAEAMVQALRQIARHYAEAKNLVRALNYTGRAIQVDPLREELTRDAMLLYHALNQPSAAVEQYRVLEQRLKEEMQSRPSASLRKLAQDIEARMELKEAPALPASRAVQASDEVKEPGKKRELPGYGVVVSLESNKESDFIAVFCRECEAVGGHLISKCTAALDSPLAASQLLDRLEHAGDQGEYGGNVKLAIAVGELDASAESVPVREAGELLSICRPGQALISEEAAGLLKKRLPTAFNLHSLGPYGTISSGSGEQLFELESSRFTAFGSPLDLAVSARPGNLPLTFNTFVGRGADVDALKKLLGAAETVEVPPIIVTLTGPGGTGKTRLALHASHQLVEEYDGGVWFVPFAEFRNERSDHADHRFAEAIRNSLGLSPGSRVDPIRQVSEFLSRRPALLVLDNLEHVIDAARDTLMKLAQEVPNLRCICTSRQRMGIDVEREYPLSPLAMPQGSETRDALAQVESAHLFVSRAQAARPYFQITEHNAPAIARLCRALEGIPLAIELAASRVQALTPGQMLERLQSRFDLLTTTRMDVPLRQRTLRNAIEWSYDLLAPDLQQFFTRLSVFVGDWSLEAAEEVCEDPLAMDHLAQLRDCSLIQWDEEEAGGIRFRMLESIRAYASDRLKDHNARLQHAAYFLALAEKASGKLDGPEQGSWSAQLAGEHDNLRAALLWLLADAEARPDSLTDGARLCLALEKYWQRRGHFGEASRFLRAVINMNSSSHPSTASDGEVQLDMVLLGRLYGSAGWFSFLQGDLTTAGQLHRRSLEIFDTVGDPVGRSNSLNNLGLVAQAEGRPSAARQLFEESLALAIELGDRPRQASRLSNLGLALIQEGRPADASTSLTSALEIYRGSGDQFGAAACLCNLGELALEESSFREADALLQEALRLLEAAGDKAGQAYALVNRVEAAIGLKDFEVASLLARDGFALCATLEIQSLVPALLDLLARLRNHSGASNDTVEVLASADVLREGLHIPRSAREAINREAVAAAVSDEVLRTARVKFIARNPAELAIELAQRFGYVSTNSD